MNFKKNFKRFFTLSRNAEGFTLVELIVVIAILGILSTVAVPAYTKYVDAAGKAVDEQNLSMMNSAFAVACAVNGADVSDFKNVGMEWSADGKSLVKLTTLTRTNTDNDIIKDFNESLTLPLQFKLYTKDDVKFSGGKFFAGVVLQYTPAGSDTPIDIVVSKDVADALKNNTFVNSENLGADVLLGKVDDVSNIATGLIGTAGSDIAKIVYGTYNAETGEYAYDNGYLENLAKTLGMNEEQFDEFINTNDMETVLGNSLVLSAAQSSVGMSTDFLGNTGSAATLRTELSNPETATDAMAKLALTYGMYTSYVNSEQGKKLGLTDQSTEILASGTLTGMTDVLKTLENDDFRNYLASDEGKADLDAYMASMQVINDSANSSPAATKDILVNGFESEQLKGLLGGLMGTTTTTPEA